MNIFAPTFTGQKIRSFFLWFNSDARHSQILGQSFLLLFGLIFLRWSAELSSYGIIFAACIGVQTIGILFTTRDFSGLKSVLISALSLCLIFKANHASVFVLAAVLSVASKYLIRFKGKHIFNPTNFGIIATIILTGDAWISPGLWGSGILILLLIVLCGFSIVSKVKRLDAAFSFLIVFSGLHFMRQVVYLGWEPEVYFHHLSSGTLLLFTFFMITDPVTTPNARPARIIWAALVGLISFVVSTFYYVHTAPIWVLFFCAPLTIFFNRYFKGEKFNWNTISKSNKN